MTQQTLAQAVGVLVNERQQLATQLGEVGHTTNGEDTQAVEAVSFFDGRRQVDLIIKINKNGRF
jgi:hypothetical protein